MQRCFSLCLTWKFLPSGEKTEFERSYPVPIDVYHSTYQLQRQLVEQLEHSPIALTYHDYGVEVDQVEEVSQMNGELDVHGAHGLQARRFRVQAQNLTMLCLV